MTFFLFIVFVLKAESAIFAAGGLRRRGEIREKVSDGGERTANVDCREYMRTPKSATFVNEELLG